MVVTLNFEQVFARRMLGVRNAKSLAILAGTVFAYGQTSSGKTYVCNAPPSDSCFNCDDYH